MVHGKETNDSKYEAQFKGPYEIFQTCTNGNVTIQMGGVKDRLNILHVKPYKIMEVDWIRPSKEVFNIHISPEYINVTNKYVSHI